MIKCKYLKKRIEDDLEYLEPTDLIDEINDPDFKYLNIGKPICDVLNYYQFNTPDAFGNAPYQRLDGFMQGYLLGAGYTLEKSKDLWTVRKGTRRVLVIEVPKRPDDYYEAVKDNISTRRAVFGG